MQKSISLSIVLLMVVSGLTVLASSGWTPQGDSEKPEVYKAHILDASGDHYWIGTTTDTSVAANWQPAEVPATGDNIYFSALSTGNSAWALTGSYGSFNLLANFSRVVTQAASFSVTSYSQAAGTYTGSTSYIMSDSGDWVKTGGTVTADKLCLNLTGSGAISSTSAVTPEDLFVIGSYTLTGTNWQVDRYLKVFSPGVLTISTSSLLYFVTYVVASPVFSNTGTITGAGTMEFYFYNKDMTFTPGICTSRVIITLDGTAAASHTLTLSGPAQLGVTTLNSGHASNTMTLDLSASNYALSATDITIGTRGILNGRGSAIASSGNWDSSAGTFTRGTSTVTLTGTTKTLKAQTTLPGFDNLGISGTYTLQSNIWAKNLTVGGTATQATYRMNATTSLSALGSWNGNIYLNGTATSYQVVTTVPWNGFIYTQAPTKFFNGSSSLQVSPPASTYAGVKITRLKYDSVSPSNIIMFSCVQTTGRTNFTALGQPDWAYQIFVGGVFLESRQADGLGYITWGYTDWSTKFFNVTGTEMPVNTNAITTTAILTLLMGMAFVFIFLFVGLKNPWFLMVDGVLWIGVALTIFIDYGDLFTYPSMMIGAFVMIMGAWKIAD